MVLARVAFLIGTILRWFGLALLVPAGVAVLDANRAEVVAFLVSAAVGTGAGQLLRWVGESPSELRRPDALAVVAFTYVFLAVAGSLPYLLVGLSPIDALFESMSGLTTTGGTALTDFALYGRGVHFWRALSHWLGGIGVVTLYVAVLPKLAIGGRDLFFAEASGPTDEALTPQIRKTAAGLGRVYLALTAAAVVALLVAGLSAVRRDRPRLRHRRGRRLLAAPAVGHGVSPARRGVDAHVLHVPGRRQLRPPLSGAVPAIDAHLP